MVFVCYHLKALRTRNDRQGSGSRTHPIHGSDSSSVLIQPLDFSLCENIDHLGCGELNSLLFFFFQFINDNCMSMTM